MNLNLDIFLRGENLKEVVEDEFEGSFVKLFIQNDLTVRKTKKYLVPSYRQKDYFTHVSASPLGLWFAQRSSLVLSIFNFFSLAVFHSANTCSGLIRMKSRFEPWFSILRSSLFVSRTTCIPFSTQPATNIPPYLLWSASPPWNSAHFGEEGDRVGL